MKKTLFAMMSVLALAGCAVEGVGYENGPDYGYGGVGVGVGIDYYEPYGSFYGGWGPSYRVGPYRGGERRFDRGPGVAHHYRSAPPSRPMPSLPSRGHSRGGPRRSGV